jgi:hypothetical protein
LLQFLGDGEVEGKQSKKNRQRSKSLRPKVPTAAHAEINDRLSQALGYRAPRSRDSAQEQVQSTLDEQKDILKVRLVTSSYRAMLIPILGVTRPHPRP